MPWGLIWTATVVAAMAAVFIGWAGDGTDPAAAEGDESDGRVERECLPPPPPGPSRGTFVIPAPAPSGDSGEGDVLRAVPAPGDARIPVPEGCEHLVGTVTPVHVSAAEMERMDGHARVLADCAADRGIEVPPPADPGPGPSEGGDGR